MSIKKCRYIYSSFIGEEGDDHDGGGWPRQAALDPKYQKFPQKHIKQGRTTTY
jgi:hypothetical protein